ncbi:unnamed protein product, partial [Prorocentrum cordatum]
TSRTSRWSTRTRRPPSWPPCRTRLPPCGASCGERAGAARLGLHRRAPRGT